MRVLILLALFIKTLFAEDFISEFEYGQMLYKDPRGVSCASCHGKTGEGAFIASFQDNSGKQHNFLGPDIRSLSLKKFKHSILKGGKIMPRYYLTNKESEAIFKYIQTVNSTIDKDSGSKKESTDKELLDGNSSLDFNTTEDEEENTTTTQENSIISKIFKVKQERR